MRIVFSRKGFDSSAGGAPSPIIDGRPVSLPIPELPPSPSRYGDIGFGEIVEQVTRGKLTGSANCHDDPMFARGQCWLGQAGSAQGHLRRSGVSAGDTFLFFGLFADPGTGERHHRIFGYMQVACMGPVENVRTRPEWREPPRAHPHLSGKPRRQDTIYHGPGRTAGNASDRLRLTVPGGPLNMWQVPLWLERLGLTYHADPARWSGNGKLYSARRGQEFVCDIGNAEEPRRWLDGIIAEIERES